jgi:hypothetical protein
MNKNATRIKEGIKQLTNEPYEIISGTVVSGSVNMADYTMSVLPSDSTVPIPGVLLNAIAGDRNGMILFPKDDSNVIIGSIDGPGEWALLLASEITGARIITGNVVYVMDEAQVNIQNGSVFLNISDSAFKLNTASESLFALLKDCFTYISALTVPTPSGPSGVPVNIADFTNLLTRLNNLLAS